jgi:macrolide transport system ATP-binding/permease protein
LPADHHILAPADKEGVGAQYFNVYGMTFSEGNTFNELQLNSRAQVVVLDSNARRQLFPHKAKVVIEFSHDCPITRPAIVE